MRSTTFSGQCLCGAVQYSVTTEVEDFYFCHCEQCRKITGSAFASNILTKPARINWVSGSEFIKQFDYPEPRMFTKVFCANCGSGLPYLNKKGAALIIPAGSLNHEPKMKSSHNIFWNESALWYQSGINAPKCKGFQ